MIDYNEVKNHIVDELNDVMTYLEMSEKGEGCEKQILQDIAKDEYSHARFLKHLLDKNSDIKLNDSEKELWDKVESKAKTF